MGGRRPFLTRGGGTDRSQRVLISYVIRIRVPKTGNPCLKGRRKESACLGRRKAELMVGEWDEGIMRGKHVRKLKGIQGRMSQDC